MNHYTNDYRIDDGCLPQTQEDLMESRSKVKKPKKKSKPPKKLAY